MSATFAGFTAIIIALKNDSRWGRKHEVSIVHFLQLSIGVVALTLLPVTLSSATPTLEIAWRISHAVFGAYHLFVMYWAYSKIDMTMVADDLGIPFAKSLGVPGLVSVGFNFAVAAGYFLDYSIAAYFVGVFWLLLMATLHFISILRGSWMSE